MMGWEKLMRDKCLRNELMDVHCINEPDFCLDLANNDVFIYADFLKPGYHQVLIFDPLLEKAFCKDFMLNINLREDLFPEYPIIEGTKIKSRVKNVFEDWVDDTEMEKKRCFAVSLKES